MTDAPETREYGGIELRKVREFVWEIPREGGMNAPARVLASDTLLDQIGDDRTLEQLRNATHLPGIATHALCMPDGHQGYGFPVGGVGATDATDGCLSPGAVGYDINCLSGDSEVALRFGRRCPIRELREEFEREDAIVPTGTEAVPSGVRLFTETDGETVHEVETATGATIEATADHRFETSDGSVPLGDLSAGDGVYVRPFRGLPNETPPAFTVLDASDFSAEDSQLVDVLRDRDLLPLRSTDDAFARLLKLVGYHTGDGAFADTTTWFYGDPEDLESIRSDIEALGFTPSKVYERSREHEIDGTEFDRTEYSVKSGSNAFKQLLVRLGAPDGRKTVSEFTVPGYLDRLADWQVALYLSAFFGAEMSTPTNLSAKNFYAPSVSHSRLADEREAGAEFMRGLMGHLNDLGIGTNELEVVERTTTTAGETVRFRFGVSSEASNLVEFLTTVGYQYNRRKRREAAAVAAYLQRKRRVIEGRARIAEEARALSDGGTSTAEIKRRFAETDAVNDRYVERSVYGGRDGRPRPPADFPDYEEFRDRTDVRGDGAVRTEVVDVTELGTRTVFDIGVSHDAHVFAANGFVVSNCGVRMVRTDLTYDDIRGKEEELVDSLFANVPSGLGGGGIVESGIDTVEAVLERGVEWAREEGYAREGDLARCEDEGRRPDARPEYVSQKAKDRGKNQLGSLGSGNHFLEVQRVTDVFDEAVADSFGLSEDRIVVLVHCGSRGLGHQVCTDYLREIEQEHDDLLAELPDKELAAAPAGSELAEEYYGAMCAAINFAWVNRQLITHRTRRVFERVFRADADELGMELLYDVAHNIAKREVHDVGVDADGRAVPSEDAVDNEERELYVHRKGATRAFPAGREEVPAAYRDVGQPVIIPGSMGAGSYVLVGGEESMAETFGSTAHGAGRTMSRTAAKQEYWGETVREELEDQDHVYVKAQSGATVAEEAPGVYKDVDEVVRVSDALGIGDRVARTFPVCNIKG